MSTQTSTGSENIFRVIRTPAYLILTLAMTLPLLDYANGLLPLHLSDAVWRFGATSLVASYVVATTAQLFFLFVIAVGSGDRKVLFTLGVTSVVIAVVLLMGSGLYALDTLQTRARTSAGTQTRLEMTAAVVMLKLLSLLVANGMLARSSFKAARAQRASGTIKGDPLLVRRPVPGAPVRG